LNERTNVADADKEGPRRRTKANRLNATLSSDCLFECYACHNFCTLRMYAYVRTYVRSTYTVRGRTQYVFFLVTDWLPAVCCRAHFKLTSVRAREGYYVCLQLRRRDNSGRVYLFIIRRRRRKAIEYGSTRDGERSKGVEQKEMKKKIIDLAGRQEGRRAERSCLSASA